MVYDIWFIYVSSAGHHYPPTSTGIMQTEIKHNKKFWVSFRISRQGRSESNQIETQLEVKDENSQLIPFVMQKIRNILTLIRFIRFHRPLIPNPDSLLCWPNHSRCLCSGKTRWVLPHLQGNIEIGRHKDRNAEVGNTKHRIYWN